MILIDLLYRREVIFVNRGWISRNSDVTYSKPTGIISLISIISEFEKKSTFSPVNQPNSKVLLWLEHEALLKATELINKSSIPMIFEVVGK